MTTEADLILLTSAERPPCGYNEHPAHGDEEGAVWLVTYLSPKPCGCDTYINVFYCQSCWAHRSSRPFVRCNQCGARMIPGWTAIDQVKRIRR